MTPKTKKKCEEVMTLIAKGMTQTEALQKVGVGTATISRYKASLKTSSPSPILPHSHKVKAAPKAYEKPELTLHDGKIATHIKNLTFENQKLKRENRMLRRVARDLLAAEDDGF